MTMLVLIMPVTLLQSSKVCLLSDPHMHSPILYSLETLANDLHALYLTKRLSERKYFKSDEGIKKAMHEWLNQP